MCIIMSAISRFLAYNRMLWTDFSYLFQQVVIDMPSYGISFKVKIDIHVFSKPTRVIIPVCFGISKCLQNDIGFNQDILHSTKQCYTSISTYIYKWLLSNIVITCVLNEIYQRSSDTYNSLFQYKSIGRIFEKGKLSCLTPNLPDWE